MNEVADEARILRWSRELRTLVGARELECGAPDSPERHVSAGGVTLPAQRSSL